MPEKPTNPPNAPEGASGFLQRWSQRKTEAAAGPDVQMPPDDPAAAAPDPAAVPQAGDAEAAEAPPSVTEADLENLTYDSDYTKFMGEHVPEALRRRALRQLWRSDPILANLDGLCDYDDDFTDAALAVKVLETAHKVGQGYLSDEEVAANRARGEPKGTDNADDIDDLIDEDDSEDMEDFDEEPETVAEAQQIVASDDTPSSTTASITDDTSASGATTADTKPV